MVPKIYHFHNLPPILQKGWSTVAWPWRRYQNANNNIICIITCISHKVCPHQSFLANSVPATQCMEDTNRPLSKRQLKQTAYLAAVGTCSRDSAVVVSHSSAARAVVNEVSGLFVVVRTAQALSFAGHEGNRFVCLTAFNSVCARSLWDRLALGFCSNTCITLRVKSRTISFWWYIKR